MKQSYTAFLLVFFLSFLGGCRSGDIPNGKDYRSALYSLCRRGLDEEALVLLDAGGRRAEELLLEGSFQERYQLASLLLSVAPDRAEPLIRSVREEARFREEDSYLRLAQLLAYKKAPETTGIEQGFTLIDKAPGLLSDEALSGLAMHALEKGHAEHFQAALKGLWARGRAAEALDLERLSALERGDQGDALLAEAESLLYAVSLGLAEPERRNQRSSEPLIQLIRAIASSSYQEAATRFRALDPSQREEKHPFMKLLRAVLVSQDPRELYLLHDRFAYLPRYHLYCARAERKAFGPGELLDSHLESCIRCAPFSADAFRARALIAKEYPAIASPRFFLLPQECKELAASPLIEGFPPLVDLLTEMLLLPEGVHRLAASNALLQALSSPKVKNYILSRLRQDAYPSSLRSSLLLLMGAGSDPGPEPQ